MVRRPLLLLMSVATGCLQPGDTVRIALDADTTWFADGVQPVVATRCSNPSCHGTAQRPLELYAVHQHRLDPADVYLDQPLTDAEIEANLLRVCAFLWGAPNARQSELLRKPLAVEAGGMAHEGGTIFGDRDHHEYRVIEAWADDALAGGNP